MARPSQPIVTSPEKGVGVAYDPEKGNSDSEGVEDFYSAESCFSDPDQVCTYVMRICLFNIRRRLPLPSRLLDNLQLSRQAFPHQCIGSLLASELFLLASSRLRDFSVGSCQSITRNRVVRAAPHSPCVILLMAVIE